MVFLVNLSVAQIAYHLAIIFNLYVIDIARGYKLFFKKGLDKFSTATCGHLRWGWLRLRRHSRLGGGCGVGLRDGKKSLGGWCLCQPLLT